MAKMQALNSLPDAAMRAAYNFIKEHSAGIGVTLRELRLIIKNIGKMAGEKLKALTDWVKKKPAHYDKIEAEGLELLQEEEAELAEKGLLDKVDEALQKESEGLADDAALGMDDVEAVIEKAELEGNVIIKSGELVFGSNTKSAQKLANQMKSRGWTESLIKDTVDNPYTVRNSLNKATGNRATVFYTKQGSYVIIDNITKEIVQISDNINPSTWIPDTSIEAPYKPE